MKYIVCKHFKTFNKGTTLNSDNNIITYNGNFVCYATSQNAYDYLARNDDEKGYERYNLTQSIFNKLKEIVNAYNEEYAKITSTFTEETTDEEKELALANLENIVAKSYDKIYNIYPNFLRDNVFTFDFYNANVEALNEVLEVISE